MTNHPGAFINKNWVQTSGTLIASHDPGAGTVIWKGHSATDKEINEAVASAKAAAIDWSAIPFEERVKVLRKFQDILRSVKNPFAEIISSETGKPLWDSRGEVDSMIGKLDISIDSYHKRCPELQKEYASGKSITRHKPHGVIAVLGPFNFPGHLPNGHIVPALLAGNTIVFKPSELTPYVGEEMIRCWEQTDLPPGVINLVQGGREVGQSLAYHDDINGLFFTGSYRTGKILSEHFGKHPEKILALEMGGNNPYIVSKISGLIAAAYATVLSAYLSAGQRCTCARRLIVIDTPQGNDFVNKLKKMIENITVGHYTEVPEPFMGPVISEDTAQQLLSAQKNLHSKGGKILVEMTHLKAKTGLLSPGLIDVTHVKNLPDDEYFGPLLQLIFVKDLDAAIAEANRTTYGLTAGILTDSKEEYRHFYQNVNAGVVNWNAPLTGASSAAPFGGIGWSGNHRPSAFYAADYCSYPVASMENEIIALPAHIHPGVIL